MPRRSCVSAEPATVSAPRKRARLAPGTSGVGSDHDAATTHLLSAAPQFASLVAAYGPASSLAPVAIPPGGAFASLLKTIIYQQLAGKAAATIHGRVLALLGSPPTPGKSHTRIPSLATRRHVHTHLFPLTTPGIWNLSHVAFFPGVLSASLLLPILASRKRPQQRVERPPRCGPFGAQGVLRNRPRPTLFRRAHPC